MAEPREGFEIKGRFYPWAQRTRVLDKLLISEVTGMTYLEFLDAWQAVMENSEDGTDEDVDPVVLNGLIAMSIWQEHTDWTRAKVVRYLERLPEEDIEVVGAGDEDDVLPPTSGETGQESTSGTSASSGLSPSTSNGTQESPVTGTPPTTGPQLSAISSQG